MRIQKASSGRARHLKTKMTQTTGQIQQARSHQYLYTHASLQRSPHLHSSRHKQFKSGYHDPHQNPTLPFVWLLILTMRDLDRVVEHVVGCSLPAWSNMAGLPNIAKAGIARPNHAAWTPLLLRGDPTRAAHACSCSSRPDAGCVNPGLECS